MYKRGAQEGKSCRWNIPQVLPPLAALTELEWTKGVLREVMPVAMSSKFWPYFGPEDLPHWDTATTLNLFCRCCANKGVSNSPRSIPSNGSASYNQEGVPAAHVIIVPCFLEV